MNKITFSKIFLSLYALISFAAWAQDDESILFVTSQQLKPLWTPVKKVAPVYPSISLSKREQGCVAVGYIIESDGSTSSHRVVASYPANNFYESSIDAAKQFLYEATEANKKRVPVFTINTFTYEIEDNNRYNKEARMETSRICTTAAYKVLGANVSEAGDD